MARLPGVTSPEPQPRRTAAATSLLIAVGLNLAGLAAFGAVTAQWRVGSSRPAEPGQPSRVTTVYVVPQTAATTVPEPIRSSSAEPHRAAAPSEVQRPAPLPAAPTTPAPTTALPVDATNTVRYYRIGEVDTPAMPDSDWNLDTAALDTVGLSRMVFEVFVGSDGMIVECTILEPKALAEGTRKSLEDRLRQTVLQPAMRGGAAVPSLRRIEISVLPGSE